MADIETILGIVDLLGKAKRAHRRKHAARALKVTRPKRTPPGQLRRPAIPPGLRKLRKPLTPRRRRVRTAVRRLPTPAKIALIKRAIRRKPALRKKVARAILKKRIQARMDSQPTARYETPVPSVAPSAEPVQDPSPPAVLEEEARTPAEAVEEEMDEGALEDVAEEEAAEDAAVEETIDDVEEELAEDAEDAEEETEEAEGAEDDSELPEDPTEAEMVGYLVGKLKAKKRVKSRAKRAIKRAIPRAKAIEKITKGKIPAKQTLKGCAIILAARRGDKKAKTAIAQLSKRAKAGDTKAGKTLAQLKLCSKAMATRPAVKPARARRPLAPYSNPVRVVDTGFGSWDPYQRAQAMVPIISRARYGR